MAILEFQNINTASQLGGKSAWKKNLGYDHYEEPANDTFGGFKYGPPALPAIKRTIAASRTGPRGVLIQNGSSNPGSYGPDIGARFTCCQ